MRRVLGILAAAFAAHALAAAAAGNEAELDTLLEPEPSASSAEPEGTPPPASPDPALATIPVQVPAETDEPPRARRTALMVEEIVVTAQRREEAINDVPIAVSAFTGEALQELGITDTRDLGSIVPGLSVSNAGFNKPVYTLRGIGFNETSQTASSTVGVYVDEMNFPFDIMTKGANIDLQRVEVLKGPQGTLYGRNTTGGAVNYVANKPTESFESGINGGLSSFQASDVEGFISGPLADSLRARFALRDIRSQEGWQYSLTRPDDRLGKVDKQSMRLILDWLPIDALPVSITLQGWRDHSQPQVGQPIAIVAQNQQAGEAALDPSVRDHPLVPIDTDDNRVADWPTDLPWRLKDRFLMASARTDWALSETTTLIVQGGYEDFLSDNSLLPQTGLSVLNVENRLFAETRAFILELRLTGALFEVGQWLLGAYLSRDTVFEDLLFYVDTNSAVFPQDGMATIGNRLKLIADQQADTQAVFGTTEWPFLDTFKATLGLRYTTERRAYSGCTADSTENTQGAGFANTFNAISVSQGGTGGAGPGDCFSLDEQSRNPSLFTDELDEDNVSGRLALDWQPTDDLLFYVSYSRGFKSGSFPAISAAENSQLEPVTQEQLDAYEVGGKLTLLEDQSLQANVAVFDYDYRDKQLLSRVLDPIFGPLPVLRNAPKSKVRGAELELQYSPLDGLYLSAAGAYIETEVIEFIGVDEEGVTRDFAGNEFNFTPKISYTLLANYVFPVGAGLDVITGADYGFKDKTNSVLGADPLYAHDAFGVVNARLGLKSADDAWTVTAWGRNVTNEFYTISIFDPGDTVARYTGMPRTFGLTLARSFN